MSTPATTTSPDQASFHARQVGTTELSAAARLDRATEDRLYRLYRDFFQHAEDERNWNLWEDIPWDKTVQHPPAVLSSGALTAYQEALFLPDYSSEALKALRASRGRAWFLTRWSYEEMKHSLMLAEWLVRAGVATDAELKALGDDVLPTHRWQPPFFDAPAIFVDMLHWEQRQVNRFKSLRQLALGDDDHALVAALDCILLDDRAHEKFLREALDIIAETYPEQVQEATNRVLQSIEAR